MPNNDDDDDEGKKLQFSDGQLQISKRGDMGVYDFNFPPKFPPNVGLSAPNVVFLEENLLTRRKFFDSLKLGGGGQ